MSGAALDARGIAEPDSERHNEGISRRLGTHAGDWPNTTSRVNLDAKDELVVIAERAWKNMDAPRTDAEHWAIRDALPDAVKGGVRIGVAKAASEPIDAARAAIELETSERAATTRTTECFRDGGQDS